MTNLIAAVINGSAAVFIACIACKDWENISSSVRCLDVFLCAINVLFFVMNLLLAIAR